MSKIKIALLGLGNVGSGVWKILNSNRDEIKRNCGHDIEVGKILVRNIDKKRQVQVPHELITTDFNEILNDDSIDIVVEVMGGITPTKDYILSSIRRGKHIVTANKMLLATEGDELFKVAHDNGVNLYYEASVAGGIPVINSLSQSLTANKIEELFGIVNGTTNYILTKMQFDNMSFEDALKEAQEKGYAEADMSSDIDAYDAQYKLAILSSLAFGTNIDVNSVYREGISNITSKDMEYAKELGFSIKLLAIVKDEDTRLELRVHPTMIPNTHPLANVNSSFNGIFIKGNAVGELMFYGRGAGDLPTGSAVVGDIIAIIKNINSVIAPVVIGNLETKEIKNINDVETKYYVRATINDDCETVGKLTTILAENNVSLEVFNKKVSDNGITNLTFITSRAREINIRESLEKLSSLSVVNGIDSFIRVESLN